MMLGSLPADIRLVIYDLVLADTHAVVHAIQPYYTHAVIHAIQPCNTHFRLLHACRQFYYEARPSFSRYVSLRNEFQIERFYHYISSSPETALSVRWADVANDGRIVETLHAGRGTPASQLYRVLAQLTCLEHLRVFDVRRYYPYIANFPQLRYRLDVEGAMYPADVTLPRLTSYELYLEPSTPVTPFDRLSSDHLRSLRLSGDCHLNPEASFPALRHLTIRSVTSNAFDRVRFNSLLTTSQLESFTHAQGDRLGFEIRNVHLESIVDGPGRALRKLVLLGSTCLTTSVIATCVRNLPMLEYFALALVTVNELREDFVVALGPSLRTLKLQITHAWYAVPLLDEERILCNSLEERVLSPKSRLHTIYVSFHNRLMVEDGREERWKCIAHAQHLTLKIGSWEDNEEA